MEPARAEDGWVELLREREEQGILSLEKREVDGIVRQTSGVKEAIAYLENVSLQRHTTADDQLGRSLQEKVTDEKPAAAIGVRSENHRDKDESRLAMTFTCAVLPKWARH